MRPSPPCRHHCRVPSPSSRCSLSRQKSSPHHMKAITLPLCCCYINLTLLSRRSVSRQRIAIAKPRPPSSCRSLSRRRAAATTSSSPQSTTSIELSSRPISLGSRRRHIIFVADLCHHPWRYQLRSASLLARRRADQPPSPPPRRPTAIAT